MNRATIYLTAWMIALCLAVFSYAVSAQQVSNRAGKMETSIQFNGIASEDIDGDQDSRATVESDLGVGFNFSYNVNNHWAFGLEFSWRESDYTTTVTPAAGNPDPAFERSGTLESSTTSLTATYHFSPSRFTPLIQANVGRTWIDTNIPDGPPVVTCWYDPWWGQYCGPAVPTKSDDYWSYGVGFGLRWDSGGPFFVRALASEQWLDVGGSVGTPSFTQFRLDLGFGF